jgi:phytoene synthase
MAGEMQPGFAEFMAFQISRARHMYRDALAGVPALNSPGRLATLTAAQLYAGILNEIERVDYDVFQGRVSVPSRRRATGVARATLAFARGSIGPSLSWRHPITVEPLASSRWRDSGD